MFCHAAPSPSVDPQVPEREYICLQRQVTTEQLATMPSEFEQLNSQIKNAPATGELMESAAENIRMLLGSDPLDLYFRTVNELVTNSKWSELNDRFYQTLAFGTGGLRGRTIGKIVTVAERGKAAPDERPEFP